MEKKPHPHAWLSAHRPRRASIQNMYPAIFALLCLTAGASAQSWQGNHDESKVKPYTLPDPLTLANGKKVRNAAEWQRQRRPEILRMFETEVYGRTPAERVKAKFETISIDKSALGGKAVRKQVRISFPTRPNSPVIHVLVYLPAHTRTSVPVFVGLNFTGNHTVHSDPGITLRDVWVKGAKQPATEDSRGRAASQWQVESILARGYALATAYYFDVEPDFNGGFEHGVRKMLLRAGQTAPADDAWGAIGAWAWGLSRIADYLVTDSDIDAERIAVMGHSRLGKTALWAGAQDARFGLVISNDSGEGGAALSKRNFGEDVWRINNSFPHWFATNYRRYANKESEMPFDQHMLIALIAPRAVYVASAAEDLHADPRGEFLAAAAAGPVYELFDYKGLGTDTMPALHQPIMHRIGYHVRAGKHDVTAYDWERYCDFADLHWPRR
jgi:hypothetical protein